MRQRRFTASHDDEVGRGRSRFARGGVSRQVRAPLRPPWLPVKRQDLARVG
jgi:hypothetical protein